MIYKSTNGPFTNRLNPIYKSNIWRASLPTQATKMHRWRPESLCQLCVKASSDGIGLELIPDKMGLSENVGLIFPMK